MAVMPYVRHTRTTRWRHGHASGVRARAYNESRAALRDALTGIMLAEGISPFPAVKLGMASKFVMPKANVTDLGNYEKALEDACNGIVFPDDRWIWKRGEGGKEVGQPGRFTLKLWEY